jgi:hypothetical protein
MVPQINQYGGDVMPAITLKNIPPELYERLKQSARANRRSLNSEILVCIERAIGAPPRQADEIVLHARKLRDLTAGYKVADEVFTQAKSEGRP